MTQDESPAARLMSLVNGYQVSQAIHAASALRIADHLADGAMSCQALAAASSAHSPSLYRLLRALASVGVFREEPDQRFTLTPMAECLRSDAARPVGPWADFIGRPYVRRAWDGLLHSVRTGENAFHLAHGTDVWDYRAGHPDEARIFDHAMRALSRGVSEAIAAAYRFGRHRRIVDVGGGTGTLIAAILAAHPTARGVLFDLPHVVAGAAPVLDAAGVAERCEVAALFKAAGLHLSRIVATGGRFGVVEAVIDKCASDSAAPEAQLQQLPGA